MALKVGNKAPDFKLNSHDGREIRLSDYRGKKNLVMAFFPLAWTPVCTSQIPSYQAALDRFDVMETQVLALSVDSVPCLKAWTDSLGGITYPVLSDFYPHGAVASKYGVLRKEGRAERAIFVIDKQGILRYIDVHDIEKQPNNDVLFAELAKLEPELMVKALNSALVPGGFVEPKSDVVMYCTAWCPGCREAREWFSAHDVEYIEVDISKDRAAAVKVREWTGGYETTPTLNIRGTIIVNWDKQAVAEALGK